MRAKKMWLVGVPLAIVAALGAGRSPGLTMSEPECVAAQRWVNENSEKLPLTLAGFSRYSLAYRKAIFLALPRERQLAIWHEQFAHYRGMSNLTPEQRAFLTEVDAELEEYFGVENAVRADARYNERAKRILGDSLARQVFANLGVNTPENQTDLDAVQGTRTVADCGCSNSSDWCEPTGLGCGTNAPCSSTTGGCGTFWCHPCDGDCNWGDVLPDTGMGA